MPPPIAPSTTERSPAALRSSSAPRTVRLCSDDARLASLLRDNFSMVWAALRRLGVAADAVDDAAQEVFIIAARRLVEVEAGRERPYLYAIALRVAANARRASRRSIEHADDDAITSQVAPGVESDALLEKKRWRTQLDAILNGMPEELRSAFVLFEFEGFSEREVAELCAIPQGTAASRLRRARVLFQEAVRRLKLRLSEGGSP